MRFDYEAARVASPFTPSPRTRAQDLRARGVPDTTQDFINRQIALQFSPARLGSVLFSAPEGRSMRVLDGTLVLMPSYDKLVVDRINRDCLFADLGGGSNTLMRFPRLIETSCVAVGAVYKGLGETYSFSTTTPGYGRLYSSKFSQALCGRVRRHLFDGIYEDVDIVNAQPNMVRQLMVNMRYDGPMEALAEYCDRRDEALALVMHNCSHPITRDDAKSLFLTILFGSTLRAWEAAHGNIDNALRTRLLVPYEKEVGAFVKHFMRVYGAEVAQHDLKTDEEIEADGKSVAHRRLSLFFQNEERIVMSHVATFLGQISGASIGVLVHDGMLVYVPGGAATIIAALEAYVATNSKYRLTFSVKSMTPTESLDELVTGLQGAAQTGIVVPVYDPKKKDDMLFLNAFMEIYKDNIVFTENGTIWHYGDSVYKADGQGMWHKNPPPQKWWANAFPETPYSQEAVKILTIQRLMKSAYVNLYHDVKWEKYDEHCFPTRDCLAHLMTDETRAYSPELMINRKCDLPYVNDVLNRADYAEEVLALSADNARLYNDDDELAAAVEERLAYCLFVRGNPLKKIFNLVGAGNNGKSTLLQRVSALGGCQFATSLDAAHLCSRQEPTKPNPAMNSALMCNLVTVEEPCAKSPFSCAQLKEYSGNTQVKARNLYENMSAGRDNNMTLVICSNAAFATAQTDQALLNRVERVDMPCKFYVCAAARAKALAAIECAIERSSLAKKSHVGDTGFAKRYESTKMRQVYFAFLKQHYANYVRRGSLKEVPEAYSYAGCEDAELEATSVDMYDLLVEETGDPAHYMSTKALAQLLAARSTISLGREIKSRIDKSDKVKVARKNKTNGFSGIRPRNQDGT
jgi:hypothetical protein